jgi:hypothetical protein
MNRDWFEAHPFRRQVEEMNFYTKLDLWAPDRKCPSGGHNPQSSPNKLSAHHGVSLNLETQPNIDLSGRGECGIKTKQASQL